MSPCLYIFVRSSEKVERGSLVCELSLSCAQSASDEWPVIWVNRPLQVSQLGQLSLSSFRGMSALVAQSGECLRGEGLVWLIGGDDVFASCFPGSNWWCV